MKTRIVAPLVLLLVVLSGCGQAEGALDQARDLKDKVESVRWCSDVVRLAAAVNTANPEAARNLVDVLERTAPEDLDADVEVVRAAVREIEAGDAKAKDLPSDDVNAAMGRLVDAVEQRCDGEVGVQFSND